MTRRLTRQSRGFSLIELLVAMAIGLILTLAITSVLIRTEGSKRSSNSVNDINQSGAYAAYVLDRAIRSAGSGFSQSWATAKAYGCLLDVTKSGTQVLPLPSAIPSTSAFARFTLPIRLAPVVIGKDLANTSTETRGDVLMVMAGTAGVGESPQNGPVDVVSTPPRLMVSTGLGYVDTDMFLIADPSASGCMLQQVAGNPAPAVPTHAASDPSGALALGGTYFHANGANGLSINAFTGLPTALQLGRDGVNPPLFQLYGVGANNTLMSYDLLQPTPGDASVSDGVVEMRAIYGLDTSTPPDGSLDTWVDASGAFDASVLTDGSDASRLNLRRIVAVRIGMILRTSLQERAPSSTTSGVLNPETFANASNTTLTLFADLPTTLQKSRVLSSAELGYRFRTVEVTIPLRNVLLAPPT